MNSYLVFAICTAFGIGYEIRHKKRPLVIGVATFLFLLNLSFVSAFVAELMSILSSIMMIITTVSVAGATVVLAFNLMKDMIISRGKRLEELTRKNYFFVYAFVASALNGIIFKSVAIAHGIKSSSVEKFNETVSLFSSPEFIQKYLILIGISISIAVVVGVIKRKQIKKDG